ncbi:TPA: 30S ribosomal protein S7 [Candidatus Dependentiae bacterium]|nr:MAG: 30S ribosomal protein S7 [candidate division TM6 bacterium GW2011_GWE2_31_21]KKP53131.1 MAG: 30S ribosomal protein S7 [candidate division TM6 bacterium GW2011_GWF2_33_332]HBS47950.1 30S ribosomal protein S7 [Candidatus Dependentiae bacterium]HBZ73446.1 30S ribosomal protein S7 [Candidatus Dependentiae bacterium]
MPRRKSVNITREIGVDPRFKSEVVQKFINVIMERGKKDLARSIVYGAFDVIAKKTNSDDKKAFIIFEKAIDQVRPLVEVKPRRVGGGVYQIPVEVRTARALALSFRWIKSSAQARSDKSMSEKLAAELLEASEGRGNAIKKKLEVHKMAESNRAFSHYAW